MADPRIIGYQTVAPMEASFVPQANQRRIDLAEPVIGMLASLRGKINLLDNVIGRQGREANEAWRQVHVHNAREYQSELSNRAYWIVMTIIMAIEVPLNARSLDFARLATWETWTVATGFGALNFFGAKFVGRVLRQQRLSLAAWRDWLIAIAVVTVLGVALTQFAALRQLDPHLGASAWAFLALQATFFVIVAAVSFYHFDPDMDREQLHRRIARIQRTLRGTWRQRVTLAKTYNAKRAKIELKIASIEEDTHDRIAQYRVGNLGHPNSKAPSYMKRALRAGVFTPIALPPFIDEEPRAIRALVESFPTANAMEIDP